MEIRLPILLPLPGLVEVVRFLGTTPGSSGAGKGPGHAHEFGCREERCGLGGKPSLPLSPPHGAGGYEIVTMGGGRELYGRM